MSLNAFLSYRKIQNKLIQIEIDFDLNDKISYESNLNDLIQIFTEEYKFTQFQLAEIVEKVTAYFDKFLILVDTDYLKSMFKLSVCLIDHYFLEIDLEPLLKKLLNSPRYFTRIFLKNDVIHLSSCHCFQQHDLYSFCLNEIRVLLKSAGYKEWITEHGSAHIRENIENSFYDLINFIRNKREICFLALLDYLFFLSTQYAEMKNNLDTLGFILMKDSYVLMKNRQNIIEIIQTYQSEFTDSDHVILLSRIKDHLLNRKKTGAKAENKSQELTLENVYSDAFENFVENGLISEDEKLALQELQTFIPISSESYRGVIKKYSTKIKSKQSSTEKFNREEFLYHLMVKALEDGILSSGEKEIIAKVCKSFKMESSSIQTLFEKAKEEVSQLEKPQAADGNPINEQLISKNNKVYLERLDQESVEERAINSIISGKTYTSQKTFNLIQSIYAEDDQYLSKEPKEWFVRTENLGKSDFTIIDFWVDEKPVILVYSDFKNLHPLRLKFRGSDIDVCFSKEILKHLNGQECRDKIELKWYNRCLDSPVLLEGITLFQNVPVFLEAVEKNGGFFQIALIDYTQKKTFQVINKAGYIDPSGLMNKSLELIEDRDISKAINILSVMQKNYPTMHGINYSLGFCRKLLALQQNTDENNIKALGFYRNELDLNPQSISTLSNFGVIQKRINKLDAALKYMKNAVELNPFYITARVNLLALKITLSNQSAESKGQVLEDVVDCLSVPYQIAPISPILLTMIYRLEKKLSLDIDGKLKHSPVDTAFH